MTGKIFNSIMVVAIIVLVTSIFIASTFLYEYYNRMQTRQLKEELTLIAASVDRVGMEYFDYLDSSIFRFTMVDKDGKVLYDSVKDVCYHDSIQNGVKNRENAFKPLTDVDFQKEEYASDSKKYDQTNADHYLDIFFIPFKLHSRSFPKKYI